jgi:hypothetical protein
VKARWKRWGLGLNVDPAARACSVEQLLVDTAEVLDVGARLFVLVVTWLTRHHRIVDVQRLAQMAPHVRGDASARLGLLLETAQDWIGQPVFAEAIASCYPAQEPKPLFAVERSGSALAALAKREACETSRRWGVWVAALDRLKPESLRPAAWIRRHNRTYALRCLLKGDVRSRVVTALLEEGRTECSEADLARLAGCTRKAMHTALANLEAAGLITRRRCGRRYLISAA